MLILGYSGGVILSKSGKIKIASKPNICLIHGKKDDVVPSRMMETSKLIFKENNFSIETHLIDNLGHSIDIIATFENHPVISNMVANKLDISHHFLVDFEVVINQEVRNEKTIWYRKINMVNSRCLSKEHY